MRRTRARRIRVRGSVRARAAPFIQIEPNSAQNRYLISSNPRSFHEQERGVAVAAIHQDPGRI
jgi:hypothetical protein